MTETVMNGKSEQSQRNLEALTQGLADVREAQEDALVLDFDRALEEHKTAHRPIVVKLLGRRFALPSKVPFSFVLFAQRHCFKTVNGEQVFDPSGAPALEMIEKMFGQEMLDALEQSDVDVGFVLETVVPQILMSWGLTNDEGATKKSASTPAPATPPSETPASSSGAGAP